VRHNYQAAKNERFSGSRHSDKEKFHSDLNRPKSCKISEWVLKTLQKFEDFQAEYSVTGAVTLQIRGGEDGGSGHHAAIRSLGER
jgi:hypothetical protein